MRTYAKKDTALLEPLFEAVLPWIEGPVVRGEGCPKCGTLSYQSRGIYRSKVSEFQRFRCDNGHWFRAAKRDRPINGDFRAL